MKNFKRNIYRLSSSDCDFTGIAEEIILEPFDYMIVTYQYDNTGSDLNGRDLDSATAFQNTGTVEDNKFVGCGQVNGGADVYYATPTPTTPLSNAYLFQGGDGVGNGQGESIVINFKNLELANISLNNDVRVELYAGWCDAATDRLTNVSAVTYTGGTLTITPGGNTITSTGTVINTFSSNGVLVPDATGEGCCGVDPLTFKTHVGTVSYNLVTKAASVVFY